MARSDQAQDSRYEAASLEASRGYFARALELLPSPGHRGDSSRSRELALRHLIEIE